MAGVVGIPASAIGVATAQNLAGGSPFLGLWVFGFWIWMVATGVVLFRRSPDRRLSQPESD